MGKLDVFRPKWGQHITVPVTALAPAIPIGKGVSGANKGGKIMVAYRTIVRGTGLAALGAALAATAPVLAQQVASEDESIVVTAQRENERSEEHTSELQSLMRTSYAAFCLKKKKTKQ